VHILLRAPIGPTSPITSPSLGKLLSLLYIKRPLGAESLQGKSSSELQARARAGAGAGAGSSRLAVRLRLVAA
jgi:hypothetical protein